MLIFRLSGLGVRNNFNMFVHSFSRRPPNYSRGTLKSINRQLTYGRRILKSSNRQLTYEGRILKSSNRQLTYDRRTLKSSNRQLTYERRIPRFIRKRKSLDKQQLSCSKKILNGIQQSLQVSLFSSCMLHTHAHRLGMLYDRYYVCTYNIQSLHADLDDREARLWVQEEEMKVRDAEIDRLLVELRRCQTRLPEQQV